MKKGLCALAVLVVSIFSAVVFAEETPAKALPAAGEEKAVKALEASSVQTAEPMDIPLSSKVPLKIYGFISAETLLSNQQLSSFGTDNNTTENYRRNIAAFNRVVDTNIEGKDNGFIDFTVQNSRIGIVLDPYNFGGKNFSADARLELDFWNVDNTNISAVVPRIRRAYAAIGQKSWRVIFGQEWDLFSPLNTGTLNIGNDMWRQGNLGFRRPQIRFTYNHVFGDKNGIEAAGSVNLPSNSMSSLDTGNTTDIPMEEGRLGFWHTMKAGKMWAYVSALYARHENATAGASKVNNWGVALSLFVPFHKFIMPSGEFHYGYSLDNMLSNSAAETRQRSISGWGQIKSQWLGWFETNVGYGCDDVKSSQVAAGWVKRNQLLFANLMFKPVKQFVIGFEYDNLRTTYQGSGASTANVGFMNVLFYF